LLPSSLPASEDNQESINKLPLITESMPPLQSSVGGGRRGEAPTCNACLLFAVYGFIVGVISFGVVVLLRAVIDNFIDDRKALSLYP
jgi:hypothetical protein